MSKEYVRVTDAAEETGNAWTTHRAIAEADGLKILDNDALDQFGQPLPPSRVERATEPADADVPAVDAPAEPAGNGKPKTTRTNVATEPADVK